MDLDDQKIEKEEEDIKIGSISQITKKKRLPFFLHKKKKKIDFFLIIGFMSGASSLASGYLELVTEVRGLGEVSELKLGTMSEREPKQATFLISIFFQQKNQKYSKIEKREKKNGPNLHNLEEDEKVETRITMNYE